MTANESQLLLTEGLEFALGESRELKMGRLKHLLMIRRNLFGELLELHPDDLLHRQRGFNSRRSGT